MFRLRLLLDLVKGKSPSKILVSIVKGIADGKFGAIPKKIYWAVEGYKTWVALAIMLSTFGLEKAYELGLCSIECVDWSVWLYSVSVFLFAVGLYDGGLRSVPPNKE
jgi:hypothetical protein